VIRAYLESLTVSFPLICLVSGLAGWHLNVLQQLAVTAIYVASSMTIHINAWQRIAAAIVAKEGKSHDADH